MNPNKQVLDVCCGSKMFYYDKENRNVLYCDKRRTHETLCDGRILDIKPDLICDFTRLPFPCNSFSAVIFDPPHLKTAGEKSWLVKKLGDIRGARRFVVFVKEV